MWMWTFNIAVALAVIYTTQARNYEYEYEYEEHADESISYYETQNEYSYDSSSYDYKTEESNSEKNDARRYPPQPSRNSAQANNVRKYPPQPSRNTAQANNVRKYPPQPSRNTAQASNERKDPPQPSRNTAQPARSNGTETDDFDRPDFLDMADSPTQDKAKDRARMAFYGDVKGEMLLAPGYGVRYGAGTNNPALRWPNSTIPYVIDSSLGQIRNKISRAIDSYQNNTCLRFVPRTNQRDYIYLTKGRGCSSFVGMTGGRQDVNLGSGCEYVGTIIHELGHAAGLYHEHQRSDRDKFIRVFIGNVTSGAEDQFSKINPSDEAIYTDFDYDSIMIYGNFAFSKEPGSLKTMEALNGKELVDPYNKQNLDPSDLLTLRNLYKCNGTTTNNFKK